MKPFVAVNVTDTHRSILGSGTREPFEVPSALAAGG
jgi:hypothetical protein